MRSRQEEIAAVREVMYRARDKIKHFPNAPEFLAKHAPGSEAILSEVSIGPRQRGEPGPAMCMLYRGKKWFPDNRVSKCADCGDPIQHRPDVPRTLAKLCVFCVLRRIRGDT